MSQLSLIQEANAQFIDYEPSPKVKGAPDDRHLSDIDRIIKRIGIYANNEMEWLELVTNWVPFTQTGPRERKFWSKRRVCKVLDQAEAEGLVFALDEIGSRYRLTETGVERLEGIGHL